MNSPIRNFSDSELLSSTRALADREREITMEVLKHLAEIERRKLYCDLKYASLWEYAVRELKYSDGAAHRRIQAMRLLKELPELEEKIESGSLSLTNIAQAQSYFWSVKKAEPEQSMARSEKIEVLAKLEDKSSREGERILLSMSPPEALPKERIRLVSPEHTEVKFLIDEAFNAEIEEARALLGPKGSTLTLAELLREMTRLGVECMREKRFGKRRVASESQNSGAGVSQAAKSSNHEGQVLRSGVEVGGGVSSNATERRTRHISKSIRHAVWRRDGGRCCSCRSSHRLQIDHIQPLALGGESTPENLQLLCSSCNLRRGVKTYGPRAMRRT